MNTSICQPRSHAIVSNSTKKAWSRGCLRLTARHPYLNSNRAPVGAATNNASPSRGLVLELRRQCKNRNIPGTLPRKIHDFKDNVPCAPGFTPPKTSKYPLIAELQIASKTFIHKAIKWKAFNAIGDLSGLRGLGGDSLKILSSLIYSWQAG